MATPRSNSPHNLAVLGCRWIEFDVYRNRVEEIPFGKHLPTAIYIHIDGLNLISETLRNLVVEVIDRFEQAHISYNIIKFYRTEVKISLLSYPEFFSVPHPALRTAVTIDLSLETIKKRDYSSSQNRPILHRKETFLPHNHSKYDLFRSLTEEEEGYGLYLDVSRIGFESQWEKLLADVGVTFEDHTLKKIEGVPNKYTQPIGNIEQRKIHRSRTAISRFGFSLPIRELLKSGLFTKDQSFFDYGCGQGDDIRGLQKLGYIANGWDPIHYPEGVKQHADIVNLGFVLNVIEDPIERANVLKDAFSLAATLLVLAVQIRRGNDQGGGKRFRDGILTSKGTFQRFFTHQEISRVIEELLDRAPVPVGPGIYFIFKNEVKGQGFLEKRASRILDFHKIHEEIFGTKPKRRPCTSLGRGRSLYERNQVLLDDYWEEMLRIGRPPSEHEYNRFNDLLAIGLTPLKARRLFVRLFGVEAFDKGFLIRNREMIESFWESLVEYGRIPSEEEFERYGQLSGLGVNPSQLRNLYLRTHGEGSLFAAFRERHRELIDCFWHFMISLGRVPNLSEFPRGSELVRLSLTPNKLFKWFVEEFGEEVFENAVNRRKDDLLVYLALANFKRRIPFQHLPQQLRTDLKTLFGSYKRALEFGRAILFSLGQEGVTARLCTALGFGWQDDHSLYIHRSLINALPPGLRILLGCAETLEGDFSEADLIRIHKRSSKVSLLLYDNFERKSFPVLRERIKINLAKQSVEYFDYSLSSDPLVLRNKYRFVAHDHQKYETWRKFHRRVEKYADSSTTPHSRLWDLRQALENCGLDLRLRRMTPAASISAGDKLPE